MKPFLDPGKPHCIDGGIFSHLPGITQGNCLALFGGIFESQYRYVKIRVFVEHLHALEGALSTSLCSSYFHLETWAAADYVSCS
ncbi:hypothetical protein PO78_4340 [Thauera sp. SWB20]|nr:hypothetical protein PO78_4340 [Thauera sp. SWB20]